MAYAKVQDVQERMMRTMSESERNACHYMLSDAAVIIDAYNSKASDEAKKVVSCRMVERALGDGAENGVPIGATQGSASALGYSQSWTIGAGTVGELYISKVEKKLLGAGNAIGSYSPTQALVPEGGC